MNNRKTAVNFDSFTVPKKEQKKEFSTMFEILRDAEKYDEAGEKEVCKLMLETLKNYIDMYGPGAKSVNEKILKNTKRSTKHNFNKQHLRNESK